MSTYDLQSLNKALYRVQIWVKVKQLAQRSLHVDLAQQGMETKTRPKAHHYDYDSAPLNHE